MKSYVPLNPRIKPCSIHPARDVRAVEAEPPSSSTTATGQQRQIHLNTSISGSGFSHLGTPISATCSGKSCRGSGWAMQASQGPPGTGSARVIRDSSAAENPRLAGLSAESRALAGSSQAPAGARIRQRSSNSADARAETHWVFTGITRGPVPRCHAAADQVHTDQGRRARHPALPEREMTEHLPVSTSRCEETQPAPQRSRSQRCQSREMTEHLRCRHLAVYRLRLGDCDR